MSIQADMINEITLAWNFIFGRSYFVGILCRFYLYEYRQLSWGTDEKHVAFYQQIHLLHHSQSSIYINQF